ncbi:D-alanyl-lipoteichoic acid biosynthesis protein DltD, partial [Eggerthella lenta]
CLLRRFCYTVPRSTATAFHGRLPRSNAGCSDCEGRASAPLGQYGRLCS